MTESVILHLETEFQFAPCIEFFSIFSVLLNLSLCCLLHLKKYSYHSHSFSIFLQVNSSGVMPIIFSTSSLALPATLARFTGLDVLKKAALALNPGGKA